MKNLKSERAFFFFFSTCHTEDCRREHSREEEVGDHSTRKVSRPSIGVFDSRASKSVELLLCGLLFEVEPLTGWEDVAVIPRGVPVTSTPGCHFRKGIHIAPARAPSPNCYFSPSLYCSNVPSLHPCLQNIPGSPAGECLATIELQALPSSPPHAILNRTSFATLAPSEMQ